MELFKPWTVRTYYILMRYRLTADSPAACIEIADNRHNYRNAGMSFAVELYRAAGLGVYNIYDRLWATSPDLLHPMSLERVKTLCNRFDIQLHERLD